MYRGQKGQTQRSYTGRAGAEQGRNTSGHARTVIPSIAAISLSKILATGKRAHQKEPPETKASDKPKGSPYISCSGATGQGKRRAGC